MATDVHRIFHETWLGEAQPSEGLTFSVPVLCDGGVMQRLGAAQAQEFTAYTRDSGDDDAPARLTDLRACLLGFFGWTDDELHGPERMPDELVLRLAEEGTALRPTLAIPRSARPQADSPPSALEAGEQTPASRAGRSYQLLAWELPRGLDLDAAESETTNWHYPPTAKFERLLRETRVPIGLLCNGDRLRLFYCPTGQATGWIEFPVAYMATPAGRDMLAAVRELLHADRVMGGMPDTPTTLELLEQSRDRQADVTTRLGDQVREALQILLEGFEAASHRDGRDVLRAAIREEGNHVYEGLLTVMLRLIFALYAEDRGLLPVEHPVYSAHLSVGGLYAALVADADAYGDTMEQRFGAWPRLVMLFRALHFGLEHRDSADPSKHLSMPPHRGRLFNPENYAFLEGRTQNSAVPVRPEDRARTRLPSISDGVVYRVLRRLLFLDGQRLSYSALEEEQLGSVYESLMGYEVVADRLVIQPGEERRRTSSHYTPRSLSAPIVKRTLEPLLAAIRARVARENPDLPDPQPSAEDLLNLKICDPAMGSGAFLVESCRFLATQLVAAWVREGTLSREIEASGDDEARRKPEQLARRIVAQRCLFGVDKNPLAVELGKLSLWLLTLARGQTFTFLDHCLKAGDSLVGLSKAQILGMTWTEPTPVAKKPTKKPSKKTNDPTEQLGMFADQIRRAFAKATLARQQLAALSRTSDRDDVERRQHELHVEAERALERLRDVADILISTYFFPYDAALTPSFLFRIEKIPDKDRHACLARIRDELEFWLLDAGSPPLPLNLEQRRRLVREHIRPMHWELEFPEVFADDRRDPLITADGIGKAWVDAVVGNPPFAGKNNIISTSGPAYLTWLTSYYTPSHGNSDLSAYFFRRADGILGAHGTLGLIATNTIGQGDTRETGLQPLVAAGARIYDATPTLQWPVRGASVSVSIVHMARGSAIHHGLRCRLDGKDVAAISSQLRPLQERPDPVELDANQNLCFVGSIVLGKGFVLTPEARAELIAADRDNAARIFRYLGGQELNASPTHEPSRHVIDFAELTLKEAERWPLLIKIIREQVKPERDKNNRENYRSRWWQFAERRPGLYRALAPLKRCIATSLTAKHRVFAMIPADMVMDQTMVVVASESMALFGVMQSRIHVDWSLLQGATMRSDPRYSVASCFETFPFPDAAALAADGPLAAAAGRLHEARAAHMVATNQGLTKTYNALTDPANADPATIALRRLHEQLDRAVLDAYGQTRIAVPPHAGAPAEQLDAFREQVLDFLFTRNAELAAREARARR